MNFRRSTRTLFLGMMMVLTLAVVNPATAKAEPVQVYKSTENTFYTDRSLGFHKQRVPDLKTVPQVVMAQSYDSPTETLYVYDGAGIHKIFSGFTFDFKIDFKTGGLKRERKASFVNGRLLLSQLMDKWKGDDWAIALFDPAGNVLLDTRKLPLVAAAYPPLAKDWRQWFLYRDPQFSPDGRYVSILRDLYQDNLFSTTRRISETTPSTRLTELLIFNPVNGKLLKTFRDVRQYYWVSASELVTTNSAGTYHHDGSESGWCTNGYNLGEKYFIEKISVESGGRKRLWSSLRALNICNKDLNVTEWISLKPHADSNRFSAVHYRKGLTDIYTVEANKDTVTKNGTLPLPATAYNQSPYIYASGDKLSLMWTIYSFGTVLHFRSDIIHFAGDGNVSHETHTFPYNFSGHWNSIGSIQGFGHGLIILNSRPDYGAVPLFVAAGKAPRLFSEAKCPAPLIQSEKSMYVNPLSANYLELVFRCTNEVTKAETGLRQLWINP